MTAKLSRLQRRALEDLERGATFAATHPTVITALLRRGLITEHDNGARHEITDAGLRLYANGEQSELVMLREQRDALLAAVNEARDYLGGLCDGGPVLLGLVCVLDDAIALVEGTK